MKRALIAIVTLCGGTTTLAACPDAVESPAIVQDVEVGGPCAANLECASGLCQGNVCVVPNQPPAANPGDSRITLVGTAVTLTAEASSDPDAADGDPPLTYSWDVIARPATSTPQVLGQSQERLTITPDMAGVYELELTVTDADGAEGKATTTVFALSQDGTYLLPEEAECEGGLQCASGKCTDGVCGPNGIPVAEAGASRTVPLGAVVDLDGSGSSDSDGDPLTYLWELTQAPAGSAALLDNPTAPGPSFTADVEGLFVVRLRVNDGYITSVPSTVGILASTGGSDLRPDGEDCADDGECDSQFCFQGVCKTNEPPVAESGAAQVVQVGTAVAMDGSNSYDPEGLALTWDWAINDAPAGSTATLSDEGVVDPTFTPDVEGIYVLRLVVNDGQLDSLPADFVIVAQTEPVNLLADGEPCASGAECLSGFCLPGVNLCDTNDAPIADAGSSQLLQVGALVALDGSASNDPEGLALTYAWTLVEMPAGSAATLADAAAAQTSFTADVAGIYTVALVVDDGDLSSVPDTVAIVANAPGGAGNVGDDCGADVDCNSGFCSPTGDVCAVNTPPVADAGTSATAYVGVPVTLSGSGSDAEGQPLTYAWSLQEWPSGSAATIDDPTAAATAFTPDVEGLYRLALVVHDGYDASAPAVVTYLALGGGLPDGSPCTGDTDCLNGFCAPASDTCATNLPPVANTVTPVQVTVGEVASLDGSGSSDADGTIVGYTWTLTASPGGSSAAISAADQAVASLTPDVPGDYVASLIVDDGYHLSSAGFVLVKAQAPAGTLPNGSGCSSGAECTSGFCSPATSTCQCLPASCAALGAQCGTVDNGCGDPLDCGGCPPGDTCNQNTNTCDCVPLTCSDQGFECGSQDDGCGNPIDCGGCDVVANGTGSCNASGTCDVSCDASFHACGLECLADASPDSCGTSCTPCPAPASGEGFATCTAGSCGILCNSGFEACNGDCIDPLTDTDHCGGCGVEVCDDACINGSCENPLTLEIISGDGQTTGLNQLASEFLRVRVLDANNVPQVGLPLAVTPSAGAYANPAPTNAAGIADIELWSGRAPGVYTFDLAAGVYSAPAAATLNAVTPADGTVYPLVNAPLVVAAGYTEGPGSQATIGRVYAGGMTLASDGTLYLSSGNAHAVFALSPEGEVSVVAGGNGSGDGGDGGPAVDANLSTPNGIALDEANDVMYIADTSNRRIRLLDMATGTIHPYAGGGPSGGSGGDGGPVTNAYLNAMRRLQLGPDGRLYVVQLDRIRVIDPVTGVIDHFLGEAQEAGCSTNPLTIYDCGTTTDRNGCGMSWNTDGDMFVSGRICGTELPFGGVTTWGVLRIEPDGSRHWVAGNNDGNESDGVVARAHAFWGSVYDTVLDAGGNLLVTDVSSSWAVIKRIDATSTVVTTVAGTVNVGGGGGDYGPVTSMQLANPLAMALAPDGTLLVADYDTYAVRALRSLGLTASDGLTMQKTGGDGTSAIIGQLYPALSVELVDGGGSAYIGPVVEWQSNQAGTTPQTATLATTLPLGNSTLLGRLGLPLGPQTFTASVSDLHGDDVAGSPQVFTVTAAPPADGDIITVINTDKTGNSTFTPGPAVSTRLQNPRGMAIASDGTVYIADSTQRVVLALHPDGSVSRVAGSGSGTTSGDSGPALQAGLYSPIDVALDEANQLLYIGTSLGRRVRVVDLVSGIISTVAGGGSQNLAPYGDNGPALDATFASIRAIALPDGQTIYVADSSRDAIRKVEGGLITSLVSETDPGSCTTDGVRMFSTTACSNNQCSMVVDDTNGDLFVTARWCGTDWPSGTSALYGVVRYPDGSGAPIPVLGSTNVGVSVDGAAALNTIVGPVAGVALAADGTLYFTESDYTNTVRYVDPVSGLVQTAVGDGTSGTGADHVPALTSQLDEPLALAFHPDGHLLISDNGNDATRLVWRSCAADADCGTTGYCDLVLEACTQP